jgi:hypothetical protein
MLTHYTLVIPWNLTTTLQNDLPRPKYTTTTIKPLIPNKLGYGRNETQSESIEIINLK